MPRTSETNDTNRLSIDANRRVVAIRFNPLLFNQSRSNDQVVAIIEIHSAGKETAKKIYPCDHRIPFSRELTLHYRAQWRVPEYVIKMLRRRGEARRGEGRRGEARRGAGTFVVYGSLLGAHYANARFRNYHTDRTVICIWQHATFLGVARGTGDACKQPAVIFIRVQAARSQREEQVSRFIVTRIAKAD